MSDSRPTADNRDPKTAGFPDLVRAAREEVAESLVRLRTARDRLARQLEAKGPELQAKAGRPADPAESSRLRYETPEQQEIEGIRQVVSAEVVTSQPTTSRPNRPSGRFFNGASQLVGLRPIESDIGCSQQLTGSR